MKRYYLNLTKKNKRFIGVALLTPALDTAGRFVSLIGAGKAGFFLPLDRARLTFPLFPVFILSDRKQMVTVASSSSLYK